MNEAKLKACPFCGSQPVIKQAGRTNYWWIGCEIHLGIESHGCGVCQSDYDQAKAIRKWNERAGDREPEAAQSEAAVADSLQRVVKPHLVAEIEGSTEKELWQNLNWLLCNALDSKNEHGEWPRMVSETYRGKLEVRLNDGLSEAADKAR